MDINYLVDRLEAFSGRFSFNDLEITQAKSLMKEAANTIKKLQEEKHSS